MCVRKISIDDVSFNITTKNTRHILSSFFNKLIIMEIFILSKFVGSLFTNLFLIILKISGIIFKTAIMDIYNCSVFSH